MEEKQFEVLMKRLDAVSKLLAFSIVNNKPVNEQVEILTKAGLKASDIADILGKTEHQIYVTQSFLRKKKKPSEESLHQASMNNGGGDTNA